ncbi:hypothetical protein ACFTAO_00685 [Paenibacillus rhizoplanae]
MNVRVTCAFMVRILFFSQIHPAIMATRATSLHYEVQTKVEFHPDHYSETAGMGLYYDSNNWLYVHLTHSESEGTVLYVLQAKLGGNVPNWSTITFQSLKTQRSSSLSIIQASRVSCTASGITGIGKLFVENIDVLYLSDEGVNGEPGGRLADLQACSISLVPLMLTSMTPSLILTTMK